ncbi:MAG: tetratricopeptide repeat protein [Rhodobacteraceae bacterium]|nr:tetratricopeptide repeat protein [Paracoccaceae bacterium]MCP5340862.1 tetratricopeptide repeat protein [Paracoccaceae bacterium]
MSETDSFIEEVTEEVRRDRLFALMRKYGWIGILLVVLIVGGAAYSEWQKAHARASAEAFGDAVMAAMAEDDPAARIAALNAVSADSGSRKAVLEMLAASEAVTNDDREGALAKLNAVIADTTVPDSLRQLAELKSVILAGDAMAPDERGKLLDALAAPGAPFRPLAMEQQALSLIGAGDSDGAVALLRQILEEPDVTAGLRRRTTQLIVALGADPDTA